MPALAAQPRAFSSLLSRPSPAQSVIKAFRRQGIGSADVFNTARFFLSRIESLSAAPTSLSFLRFRSKSSKSSEGGQTGPLRVPAARQCDLFRYAPQIAQTRLTPASALGRWWFLVQVCARAGKTVISRFNLCASGSCRALRACPLWHLPSVSASATRTRKQPSNTIGLPTFTRLNLITSAPLSPAGGYILGYINGNGRHLTAIASRCFNCEGMFCNLLYDICLLCAWDVLKTCNRLAWSL